MRGLQSRIRGRLSAVRLKTYEEAYQRSLDIEAEFRRSDAERDRKRPRSITTQGQSQRALPLRTSTSGPLAKKRRPLPPTVRTAPSVGSTISANVPGKECTTCGKKHPGECRWNSGACFKCGQKGHRISQCPEMAQESA